MKNRTDFFANHPGGFRSIIPIKAELPNLKVQAAHNLFYLGDIEDSFYVI